MAHTHSVKDDDNYFVINKDTMIISTESTSKTLMQHDHNSECYTFEIPRYVESHDMMECTNIEIHYIGINSNTRETNTGIYECNDLSIIKNEDGTDSDKLSFSWLISGEVTKFPGPLSFCIRFACITDSVIDYQKFTNPYNGINITSSIYNTEIVYEEYTDILQQWKNQMQDDFGTLKTNIKSEIENYKDEIAIYRDQAQQSASDASTSEENARKLTEQLTEDVSQLKGDLGKLSEEIANKTGTGLSTEAIDKLEEVGNYLTYTTADGGSKWTELISILRNGSSGGGSSETEVTLSSISATYTGGDVAVGTLLNDLTGITVTATYSDGSTTEVTDYTLSGTIAEGSNTITVSYGGKTTTFTVTGVAESGGDDTQVSGTTAWYDGVPYDNHLIADRRVDKTGKIESYSGWSTTDYLYCEGANTITLDNYELLKFSTGRNCFFDSDKNFVSNFLLDYKGSPIIVPENASYFMVSWNTDLMEQFIFIPHA